MIFLRQRWKQKPWQWGPVNRVQASLFHNAERIGIDPDTIALAMPLWGCTGSATHNYASTLSIESITNSAWKNNRLDTDTNAGYVSLPCSRVQHMHNGGNFSLFMSGDWANLYAVRIIMYHAEKVSGNSVNIKFVPGYALDFYTIKGWTYTHNTTRASQLRGKKNTQLGFVFNGSSLDLYISGVKKDWLTGHTDDVENINSASQFPTGIVTSGNIGKDAGIMDYFLLFNTNLASNNILQLSDNPYQLWQRVAPVTYFVPGVTGGLAEAVAGILIANGTLTRKVYYNRTVTGEF